MRHGIELVAPELYPDGLLMGRGEKVQYTAPSGELARALNLGGADVAAAQQRVLQILRRHLRTHVYLKGAALKGLDRHGALEEALGCQYDCTSALPQLQERAQPALLKLSRGCIGLDKDVVPACEDDGPLLHKRINICCKCICRSLVRSQYHEGPSGPQPQC